MAKTKTQAKKKRTFISKFNLSSTKSRVILTLIIFALLGGGFTVYKTFAATGYTYIGTDGTVRVSACKKYTTAFGGVYTVKAIYAKSKNAYALPYYLTSTRGGVPISGQEFLGNSYWNNEVASLTTNASTIYKDKILIMINGKYKGGGPGTWSSGQFSPTILANCP